MDTYPIIVQNVATSFEHLLQLAAYHAHLVYHLNGLNPMSLYLELRPDWAHHMDVECRPELGGVVPCVGAANSSDQIWINGVCVGNRHEGRDAVMTQYAAMIQHAACRP